MQGNRSLLSPLIKLLLILFALGIGAGIAGFLIIQIVVRGGEVEVPNLKGQSTVHALEMLNKVGLNLWVQERRFDNQVPQDCIVFQNPAEGIYVKRGRKVRVIISKGSQTVLLPDVRGQHIRQGKILLRRSNLSSDQVARVHSASVLKGHIIAQSPLPQTEIIRGTSVNLLLSEGPPITYCCLPDFTGLELDETSKIIGELGMKVGRIWQEVNPELEEGIIVNQRPPFGWQVEEDATISLAINIRRKVIGEASSRHVVISFRMPPGLFTRRLKIVVVDDQGFHEIRNTREDPDAQVVETVVVTGRARAQIYLNEELVEEREL